LVYGLPLAAATVLLAVFGGYWAWLALVPGVLLFLLLWFFRDPPRTAPTEPGLFVSPADGRIVEVTPLDEYHFFGGPAVRIGIFLSIFDVHVNRAPTEATVLETHYKRGRFRDARDPLSVQENEHQWTGFERPDGSRYAVRQVSGAIARRIVCAVRPGATLARGERFGMIKFGSRTELIVPAGVEVTVQVGDRVKGAVTVLARQI
jgi:phosphatidylserine decarboxylase